MKCYDCKDTGIAIVILDNTKDVAIQKCDSCDKLNSDVDAIKMVKQLVFKE